MGEIHLHKSRPLSTLPLRQELSGGEGHREVTFLNLCVVKIRREKGPS